MAYILNIETATKNCSVSIALDGAVIALKELNEGSYSHAEKLHPFIEDVLKEAAISMSQLDAIAVSKGPGSYTGLRIGVSAAKGLCFSLNIPLIAIETLTSLSYKVHIEKGLIVPMIDARRMEVYDAVYDSNHQKIRTIKAEVIEETSFIDELNSCEVYFIGDGALKCKDIITHENANFIEAYPSSIEMAKLSYDKYKKNDTEDVAYFEPFYLKDFVVTPQKKRS